MRRIPLLSIVLPVLLLAGAAPAQNITLEPDSIDLGTMQQLETRTVTVKISNTGGGLLVIEDVRADCGCTVPELKVKSLKPGEATDLVIHFDSKQFTGKQHKQIKITSNDPAHRLVELPLSVDVKFVLAIEPPSERVGFSRALVGDVDSKQVTFTAPDVNLRLQADKTKNGLFDVKVTNGADGDPHKSVLEVTRPARLAPGQHQDVVRVTTNVPERPTVDIEIRAAVAMEVSASPDMVNFRYQPKFSQDLKIYAANPPLDFKVLRAEIDLPEITFEILETVPRQETHIKLKGAPISKTDARAIASQGRINGTLKVYTNLKSVPVIEIPVVYMIRM
jgi:hypothetical protein